LPEEHMGCQNSWKNNHLSKSSDYWKARRKKPHFLTPCIW